MNELDDYKKEVVETLVNIEISLMTEVSECKNAVDNLVNELDSLDKRLKEEVLLKLEKVEEKHKNLEKIIQGIISDILVNSKEIEALKANTSE